jgi:hypothetical protein
MKPILVRLVAFLIPIGFSEQSPAQDSAPNIEFNRATINAAAGNYATAEADLTALTNLKAISAKLYARFTKDFRSATNISFYADRNVQIYSKIDGVTNRTLYTRKGKFIHNVRQYESNMLPEAVTEAVNSVYPRFEIFGGVAEVKVAGKVAYFVLIENKKSWKRVKVINGEVDVYEEYNKPPELSAR